MNIDISFLACKKFDVGPDNEKFEALWTVPNIESQKFCLSDRILKMTKFYENVAA